MNRYRWRSSWTRLSLKTMPNNCFYSWYFTSVGSVCYQVDILLSEPDWRCWWDVVICRANTRLLPLHFLLSRLKYVGITALRNITLYFVYVSPIISFTMTTHSSLMHKAICVQFWLRSRLRHQMICLLCARRILYLCKIVLISVKFLFCHVSVTLLGSGWTRGRRRLSRSHRERKS